MKLTDEQKTVIAASSEDRTLVLAGPGTGKTEVLARRLVHLIERGLRPSQVLVLSFSRNAVKNVADRISRLPDIDDTTVLELRHLAVRTFDSWSFRVLRQCGESSEELLGGSYESNISNLVRKFRDGPAIELHEHLRPIRHVIVDELQDLAGWRGELVLELLALVCPPGARESGFTLLGDPAQAIYGFSLTANLQNASVFTAQELLRCVRKTYADDLAEKCLVGNFRSRKRIAETVDRARNVLLGADSSEKKLEKLTEIVSAFPERPLVELMNDDGLQREGLKLAILCETNGQALLIANSLYGKSDAPPKIPIVLAAGSPAKSVPPWLGATLGRFSADSLTKNLFSRIYERLYGRQAGEDFGFGVPDPDTAWELLKAAAPSTHSQESISISTLRERLKWPDLLPDDEGVLRSSIEITTIHQSKGLEYDRVQIAREGRDRDHDFAQQDLGGLLEEANVLFVALSRAGESFERISGVGKERLHRRSFSNGERSRWCSWWGGTRGCQIEIGLAGDVSPTSFVSAPSFDSSEDAAESQAWLAGNASQIHGNKVVLVKTSMEGSRNKFIYAIHLQENGEPTRFLGLTRPQLTFDLLSIFRIFGKNAQFILPGRVFNLRIAGIISMSGSGDQLSTLHEPWSKSGVWIGVRVHGLGYFRPRKRGS